MYSPEKRATRYVPDELVLHERFLVGPLPSSALHDVFSAWQTDSNADPPVFERVYFERSKKQNEKKSADYRPLSLNNRGLVAGQIPFDIFISHPASWPCDLAFERITKSWKGSSITNVVEESILKIDPNVYDTFIKMVLQHLLLFSASFPFFFFFCFFSCLRLKNSPWVSRVEKRNNI